MRNAILLLFALAITPTTSAQTVWDYLARWEVGVGYGSLNTHRPYSPVEGIDSNSTSTTEKFAGFMVSAGWNWPLVKIKQDFGLGLTASARVILSTPSERDPYDGMQIIVDPNRQSGGGYEPHYNIPIYAMLKYGTDAHWGWRTPVGGGFGIGYQFVHHDDGIDYSAPFVVGEISVAAQAIRGVVKFQFQQPIGRTSYSVEYAPDRRTAESWSAMLLYSMHFGPRMKTDAEKAK